MKLSKQHILILVILLLLTACGFKLRGQISSLPFKTLYISAPDGSTIGMNLERAIGASSTTKVVDNAENAEATLEVISATSERIILSLSGGGRVRDFNLLYRVRYRLYDKQNVELAPITEVTLTRVLPFLDAQILAKEAEERLLQKDMEADAIQQMLWRLSTIQR
jgi:LPS-assembly lipoprotein